MTLEVLDHVWFWVSDMDRAVAFYGDVLGLELVHRHDDEWAEFRSGDSRIGLHGTGDGKERPHGGTVVFRVDDLAEAKFALQLRGVRFDEPVGEVAGHARFATFHDPDGNDVQLIEYFEEH
jgi:catechol 2,3-dioxygenase